MRGQRVSAIRFLPNDYRHWVGGRNGPPKSNLHFLKVHVENTYCGAFIVVDIGLFAWVKASGFLLGSTA
jgi:hypothetical protein